MCEVDRWKEGQGVRRKMEKEGIDYGRVGRVETTIQKQQTNAFAEKRALLPVVVWRGTEIRARRAVPGRGMWQAEQAVPLLVMLKLCTTRGVVPDMVGGEGQARARRLLFGGGGLSWPSCLNATPTTNPRGWA